MLYEYILIDVEKASVRPCALETQMSDVADGSFVRRFLPFSLCSSWARLNGAAVLVLRCLAAALLTCAAAVEHSVCVCHSLIITSGSLETWRQCTHGRASTLQTDRGRKCAPGLTPRTSHCKVDLCFPGHVLIHARVNGAPFRRFGPGYGASG